MSPLTRLVLVGLPGAGKTTVGALVAQQLGWAFVDLDAEIVRAARMNVPDIFEREGEAGFRRRERAATEALAGRTQLVLAPGGGWVLDAANLAALGPGSEVVYLDVSPEVAARRLAGVPGTRPLLAGNDFASRLHELLQARQSLYLQASHRLSVDSLSPEQVASLIVALAGDRGGALG